MWLANGLTLSRIPLAAVFWATYGRVEWSIAVILAAAVSDALDGRVARRARALSPKAGHAGEWLDPLADKVFVLVVLATIVEHGDAPLSLVLLVLARELVIVPLGIIYRVVLVARPPVEHAFRADMLGKTTTVLQLATMVALVGGAHEIIGAGLAVGAAVVGLAAAAHYVLRAKAAFA
jgi:phosphatidylglycerophosphate synthase